MQKILRKIQFYNHFILLFLFAFSCNKEPLVVKKLFLCELFDEKGNCKKEIKNHQEYTLILRKETKIENWEALGNFLYFQERITPGFVIYFNRKPTHLERKKILETYKAYYQFAGISGKLEGFEFGRDWIGSFDYLGTMLKERQRSKKEEKSYPLLTSVFPAKIKFLYESEFFNGEVEFEINLNLKKEE